MKCVDTWSILRFSAGRDYFHLVIPRALPAQMSQTAAKNILYSITYVSAKGLSSRVKK
jgi:hypothetical protein